MSGAVDADAASMGEGRTIGRFGASARWCLRAGTAIVVLGVLSAPTATAATGQLGQLASQERRLDKQILDLQSQAVLADQSAERVEEQRDAALAQLTQHVINLYKQGNQSQLVLVLGSGDMDAAVTRVKLTHDLTSYETQLVEQLDEAVERSAFSIERRELLQQQVRSSQASLVAVRLRSELLKERRRAAQGRRRSAAARAAQARLRAASPAAAQLVASTATQASFAGSFQVAGSGAPASAQSIDAYLASKGSPMAGSGFFFMLSGQRWGLDPRLLVAIAGAESNFGAITCGKFNGWGWGCPNSPLQFDSWADGIDTVAKGLRRYYLDEGRTTVVLIHRKYAPNGAANDPTGLNNHWVRNVTKFLVEQGGNPQAVAATAPGVASAASLGGVTSG